MREDAWDLEALAEADALADWMFSRFRPLARGRIAEVGAGIGTFSQRLLEAGAEELLLLEPEPLGFARLQARFGDNGRVQISGDGLPDAPSLAEWAGSCDLVVCQNVLEHIGDDRAAMVAMAAALRPGGTLAVLVPAHPRLFNALDRRFGHQRRYTKTRLRWLADQAGLKIDRLERFNALGVIGWLAQGLRRDPAIRPGSLRAYELALKPWRPFEDRFPLPVGLSLVLHARRP